MCLKKHSRVTYCPKLENHMAQHFLLSAQSRDICAFDIASMTEKAAFEFLVKMRWGNLETQTCPGCGVIDKHYFRPQRLQWRCKHCDRHFTVTTGTVFCDRKMSYKKMLLGMSIYVSSAKGCASTHLARQLNVQVRTAFMFTGKLRECLLRNRDTTKLKGEVQIDGGHFGGKPRKSNLRRGADPAAIAAKVEQLLTKRKAPKRKPTPGYSALNIRKRKKRRIVMVFRESHPEAGKGSKRTIVSIAMSENEEDATELSHRYIDAEAFIMTDENAAYNRLAAWWEHYTVQHSKEFSTPEGYNENQAESYFSRLRRCEYGIVHRIEPKYLMDLANEIAWREDVRRLSEGEKLKDLLNKVFKNGLSRWWRGYFQGHHRDAEFLML